VLAALLLAGCDTGNGFRDQKARISVTTRFEPALMQGQWVVRERVAAAEDPLARRPEGFVFGAVDGDRFALTRTHRVCEGAACTDRRTPLTARLVGPGRYVVPGMAEQWVLWADADYRVAAIGTPTGEFGWIMTKGAARDDLMQAARAILGWNGYDLALLQGVEE
jgi:apolipoprotein D and lipocalin family protein